MNRSFGRLLVLLGFWLASASANAVVTLTASPASVAPGGTLTATWSGIPSPSAINWIGLYTPGAAHGAFITRIFTNGAASGSLPFPIPTSVAAGTYQLRLFASNIGSLLATSNNFTVSITVSGTVTLGGSPLAGVTFAATNGGTCTPSNASGQYICAIPQNWSGTVTPSLSGYFFTPESRSYSNVTATQTAQNYTAVVAVQVSGRVTAVGSSLPGVAFAASSPGFCSASDASGAYSCSVPQGWSGSVTPTLAPYAFTPASRSYSNVTANQPGQDYVTDTVQVSGTVAVGALPLGGVIVAATNFGSCTSTNTSGQYSCTVPQGWSGTVTPSLANYSFNPPSRSHSNVASNLPGQDFAAAAGGAASIYFIHADHLNTPRLITSQTVQAVWKWDQAEPFGVNAANEDPSGLGAFEFALRFPGQYADKETNLNYNYFRDNDPSIGRFAQSDPLGLGGGPNTYAYVNSRPLSAIDPLGLVKWTGWGRSIGLGPYGRDEYELESECKCGTKVRIKVTVDSVGPGKGAASTRDEAEFEDDLACPNPMALAGLAFGFTATIAFRFGVSYSRTQIGRAVSTGGWSAVEGLGASIGPSVGSAEVEVLKSEDCCKK